MGLILYNSNEFDIRLKATIHSTGKLGFTEATAKSLGLNEFSSFQFAANSDDPDKLYLLFHKDVVNPDAFKVLKAGTYYYINAKGFFDKKGYDYTMNSIMFDMVEDKELTKETGVPVYQLRERSKPRR